MTFDIILFVEDTLQDQDLLFNGSSVPESLFERCSILPSLNKIVYSLPENYVGILNNNPASVYRNGTDDIPFWKDHFSRSESSCCIKIYADSPFIDLAIIMEMFEQHDQSLSEYTYSENLPSGYTGEIISRNLIESIPETHDKTKPLSAIIKANINHFDIDIFYKEPDLRSTRLSFRSGDPREKRIMENIFSITRSIPAYPELAELITSHPEILYVGPSYLEIELTGKCDLDCIFCYRKLIPESIRNITLDIDLFKKLIEDMKQNSLPYAVCFGGSGEPLMHPNVYTIIGLAADDPLISTIIIETNGILADETYRNFISSNTGKKIITIININGYTADTYTALHGKNYFDRVYENIQELKKNSPGNHSLYIQLLKINETEKFIDKYYDFWEKHSLPIILQKQNTYIGKIEDRRYSDLSPLDRIPCWHLQRDMYILSDGRIAFCKQDYEGKTARGSIREENALSIFKNGLALFVNDYKKKYPSQPDCSACDEWYTFNF